jgi:hypothetical protein
MADPEIRRATADQQVTPDQHTALLHEVHRTLILVAVAVTAVAPPVVEAVQAVALAVAVVQDTEDNLNDLNKAEI